MVNVKITPEGVQALRFAVAFMAGFEDGETQEGVPDALGNLRKLVEQLADADTKALSAEELSVWCFETEVRAEVILSLAMAFADCQAPPEAFSEQFYEECIAGVGLDDINIQHLREQMPHFDKLLITQVSDGDACDAAEWLLTRGVFGLLAKVATPVRQYDADGSDSWRSSWGRVYTGWVYADDMNVLGERAMAWALARHEQDRFKAV
ncbi:hypothetical protein [Niveispirillum cyanobacteriorum]|uniref:Uncharacterized protein n=1 Tax=Niveispirillum cyanobacteriorum TaxID=1612173 RepID=A0A2K9NDP4_9PROT|nr:hypothetical protein [Niveispirillum cyanobacteriorum]AUN31270.1 hypothetical protein C0V82_14260 [Niveispirillum cyanobacteriorum]GGE72772.1 hypothetical protein GCM10011317_32510 [Niveispirillum cyanobacteriorum]